MALGYRKLSMSPHAVGPVKAMARSLELTKITEYVDYLLSNYRQHLRKKVDSFARDHDIRIEEH